MVRIITDSASDFEPWEYEKLNVACIPFYVLFGEEEYKENHNLTKNQFFELLTQRSEMPHTSQPSPYEIESVFKAAQEAGDEAVVVPLSSGLSGTYQTMVMVRNSLGYNDCHIIDSLTGTGGQRLLVEYAVKLRDEGLNAAEIEEKLLTVRARMTLYTCMNTLEFLMRGGRISRSTYAVGKVANIKPIMHVDANGRPEIPAKMLGMRRGIDYLCSCVEKYSPDPEFPLTVMYTYDRSNGELLAERLARMGHVVPAERIVPVGAAIGTHIGPNACAVVYIAKE